MSTVELRDSVGNQYDDFILMKVESASLHLPDDYRARLKYFNRLYDKAITTGRLSDKFKNQFSLFIKDYTDIINKHNEVFMNKAKLLPLKGKYYGTKVELSCGQEITFWLTFVEREDNKAYVPSDRELAAEGITREQWDSNELVETTAFGETYYVAAKELVEACDHFEDQHSYEVALAFVEMYNEKFGEEK